MALFNVNGADLATPTAALFNINANEGALVRRKVGSASQDELAFYLHVILVDLQVLTRLRHYLCDKIRADRHLDYLRSRRILTRDDAEEISCRTTQTKRTAMLLDMLAENPHGLDALTDSIREMRSQNFIITKITDEVQKVKNEKIESLRGEETM